MKINYKTNIQLLNLIRGLKTKSREKEVALWRDIAFRLERPNRSYSEVNISRINRYTQDKDIILVPGKVLGTGELNHKLTVAALGFSEGAKEKIISNGGNCLSIEELMEQNPTGARVKIIG